MKKRSIYSFVLYAFVCLLGLTAQAQKAEDRRGADSFRLYQLSALAKLDSSFLTSAEKKTLIALQTDRSALALCSKASAVPCPDVPLPVTGLKLEGQRISAQTVRLKWKTTAEFNSKGFVLERRSLVDPMRFDSLSFTPGQGNSYYTSNYSYIDLNNATVETFYRVREVDLDERSSYSNTVAIDGAISTLSIRVANNPCNSTMAGFYVIGTPTTSAAFIVTNAAGAVLVRKENLVLTGNTYFALGSYNLPRGFYIVSVVTAKELISQKFIID